VELAGSRWVAIEVGGRPSLVGASPTAKFDLDGRVHGSTGVNRFSADYSIVGDELTLGPAVSTRMAGSPEAMAQEQAWFDTLTGLCRVRRDGERLVIEGGETTLVLVPDKGPAVIEV
jgi:heat shock protein HslJ